MSDTRSEIDRLVYSRSDCGAYVLIAFDPVHMSIEVDRIFGKGRSTVEDFDRLREIRFDRKSAFELLLEARDEQRRPKA